MSHIAVFADDLTGASASAGSLAKGFGMPIAIAEQLPRIVPGPIVLNTRSREDSSRSGLVTDWVQQLWEQGCRDFDKRIDTTLRGPAPDELARLRNALPMSPWIGVVAAYPAAGRTTRNGRQYVWEHPVTEILSIHTDYLPAYLFGEGAAVRLVPRQELNTELGRLAQILGESPLPVIFDAVCDADLIKIAEVLHRVRAAYLGPMITVSSGAVLEYYPAPRPKNVAVIIGSPTAINVQQIAYMMHHSEALVVAIDDPFPFAAVAPLIVFHSGLHPIETASREKISEHLATGVCRHLADLAQHNWFPQRLILSGGEMAQAFFDHTHAEGAYIQSSLAPLVGQGIIWGGEYHNTEIVTKGGMVGEESLLFELAVAPAVHS